MQFRCLQVAKSIHPAYKCDLSFCRGPSISMTRPRNPHSPPFALFPQIEKEQHGIFCLERPPFQRRISAHWSIATQSCECFVLIVHDRSTQSLKTPKRLTGTTPSYIVSLYTLYTACLRAVHILSPPGAWDFGLGSSDILPPVDYSDRPHGIIFSAVADCSVRALLCACFCSSSADSLSVYFLFISCSFHANNPYIISTSYPVESGTQEILSDHLQDLTTSPGTKHPSPSFISKTTGDCSSQLTGLEARRRTLVAKQGTKKRRSDSQTHWKAQPPAVYRPRLSRYFLQYTALLLALHIQWHPHAILSTQNSFSPLSSRACSSLP